MVELPIQPKFLKVTGSETEQVTEQVKRLVFVISDKALGTRDLMALVNITHRPTFLYTYLQPALEKELVEMTQADSPKSPIQKHRLTKKGAAYLKKQGGEQ